MAEYLLYCLSGSELVRCERFEAPDDDAAVAEALRLQDGNAAELWCGARRVRGLAARRGE